MPAPPPPKPAPSVPPQPRSQPARAAAPASAPKPKTSKLDVLAELERIRKQTLSEKSPAAAPARPTARPAPPPRPTPAPARPAASAASLNGKGEIHRSVELTIRRTEFKRARRFLLNLRVEDSEMNVVDAIRDLPIEISDPSELERVLLQLSVALRSKD